jgi:hypothetical protein
MPRKILTAAGPRSRDLARQRDDIPGNADSERIRPNLIQHDAKNTAAGSFKACRSRMATE